MTNTFTSFLELLKVKYTVSFSNKYFEEHPHKYNLFGISKMLNEYGIENKGVKIENKQEIIDRIDTPFIAHIGSDFVVVKNISQEKVKYIWEGKNIEIEKNDFIEKWTGNTLIAETNDNSGEPEYKTNYYKEIAQKVQKAILALAVILLLFILFFNNHTYSHPGELLLLGISLIGLYISILLVEKQIKTHSKYGDKICSLFKQKDCNDVLETKAAKLGGILGWSEVGVGYFSANIIIILFFPFLINYLALVNVCALPYTVWSIWYQKFRAHQWCMLCLVVQILLWAIFAINLIFGFIRIPENIIISDILLIGTIYTIPVLSANLLVPVYSRATKQNQIHHEINSLKMSDEIFLSTLKKQQEIEVNDSDSKILFGNPNAKLKISILTNPHCYPCSIMHKRISKLLKDTNNNISIQYLFSSFNESLDSSCHFLIASYFTNPKELTEKIYSEWYEGGNTEGEPFFRRYNFTENEEAEMEFNRHTEWKEKHKLTATPTVIVNGYKLPGNYKIEDLKYFTELDLDVR
ncbi:thioredoxin domain-containing protein [Bacteroidales bacterium OttesenSCG-928-M06]|nr:thioredoxin domain-containing protein [Bacteroidales bacterium OttesenSCG-928-M06]